MAIDFNQKTFTDEEIIVALNATNLNHDQGVIKKLVDTANRLPLTGRLAEPTGEGMADVPDSPAGITYAPNFATTDSWGATNGTVSVSNGILKCVATADAMVLFRAVSWGQKVMRFRIRPSKEMTIAVFGTDGSQAIGTSQTLVRGVFNDVMFYNPNATSTNIRLAPNGVESIGDYIEIDQMGTYIGTGNYTSRVPDKSGNRGALSFGVMPFKTRFGRGLWAGGNQYLIFDGPVFGQRGTILFYITLRTHSNTQQIFDNRGGGVNGMSMFRIDGQPYQLRLADGSGGTMTLNIGSSILNTSHFIALRFTDTQVQIRFDDNAWVNTNYTITSFLSTSPMYLMRAVANINFTTGSLDTAPLFTSDILTDAEVEAWRNDPVSFGLPQMSAMPNDDDVMLWHNKPVGFFTPALNFGGANTGITYSYQNGWYQIVGGICTFFGRMTLTSKGTAVGGVTVNGLPKPAYAFGASMAPVYMYLSAVSYSGMVEALIIEGSDGLIIRQLTEAGSASDLTNANFSNNSIIVISGFYRVY